MSLDLSVLRVLKHRDRFERIAASVPARALDPKTVIVMKDFAKFFKEFPDMQRVDFDKFRALFKLAHPSLKEDTLSVYDTWFRQLEEDEPEAVERGLMKRLMETATAFDLAALIEKYNNGDEVDIRSGLMSYLDSYDSLIGRATKSPQVLDPIEDLLTEEANHFGLAWRWPCLQRHMRPLRPGDFVIMAGRPDKGKTTALTDNLTHMAAQVDQLWPGENRSILWFNNEGPGKRIVTRCFQSALNATMEDLVKFNQEGTIRKRYIEALGGRGGALRVFDVHDMWNHEVEDIIRMHKPAMIVFDMLDNLRYGGDVGNGGQRTDQVLEAMYQWGRVRGVKYDCPVIATSQISADGDGIQYPTLSMLKDSKTGKQGAADAIVTIGAVNDPVLENNRYIGCTKNKLAITGMSKSPQQELRFDGSRGRYVEYGT
jgi:replicative DNA helicase